MTGSRVWNIEIFPASNLQPFKTTFQFDISRMIASPRLISPETKIYKSSRENIETLKTIFSDLTLEPGLKRFSSITHCKVLAYFSRKNAGKFSRTFNLYNVYQRFPRKNEKKRGHLQFADDTCDICHSKFF